MLSDNHSANLISSLRSCGISPFQPKEFFKKLSDSNCDSNDVERRVLDVMVDILKSLRGVNVQRSSKKKKKKSMCYSRKKELHSQI